MFIPAEVPAVVVPAPMPSLSISCRYSQAAVKNGDSQRQGNSAKKSHKPSLK